MRPPKVSVVMGVWNGEAHVEESCQSILNQTFQDFQIIVIDDGSHDQTVQKVRQIRDERIILKTIQHGGLTKALNHGLFLARGFYVARMDADDIALPERFEKQVQYLDQHPRVALLGTAYEIISEDGRRQTPRLPVLTTSFKIKRALPKFNPFCHGSMMIRREALERVGFYDERFRLAQDYDLWFRIAREYEMGNLSEVLLLRREGKMTVQRERRQNLYAIIIRLKAIRDGNSHFFNAVYMIRPLIVVLAPTWLKRWIRRWLQLAHG